MQEGSPKILISSSKQKNSMETAQKKRTRFEVSVSRCEPKARKGGLPVLVKARTHTQCVIKVR